MSVLTDARPKLAQRLAKRRHRMLRRVLPLVLALVVLGFAGWAVLFSTLLGVHSVDVVGGRRVSQHDVLAAARIVQGAPLSRLDVAGIAARVSKLAPVASVVVQREWPRGVGITITERVPFAVVTINGDPWLVDRSGVPFDRTGAVGSKLLQKHQRKGRSG